jgi:hypothetical protein
VTDVFGVTEFFSGMVMVNFLSYLWMQSGMHRVSWRETNAR